MGPTGNSRTVYAWISCVLCIGAAIYSWAVFITTLNFNIFPSNNFLAALAVATVAALVSSFNAIRVTLRRPERRATDRLCEEAIAIQRILDKDMPSFASHGITVAPSDTFAATLYGRLVGVRMGICVLNGWDPCRDADKEGPADELVLAYWENQAPRRLGLTRITREESPVNLIRRWLNHRESNRLCEQAAEAHRMLDDPSNAQIRHMLLGEVTRARIGLCRIHRWNPETDIDDGGRADQLVQKYRERHDPENAPDPW